MREQPVRGPEGDAEQGMPERSARHLTPLSQTSWSDKRAVAVVTTSQTNGLATFGWWCNKAPYA
jgi:hypothetical protein